MPLRSSRHWAREQVAFLIVLVALAASFGYLVSTPEHPIRGTLAIGATGVLAAVLRLVLPKSAAGLLAVRGRFVDVAVFLVLGGLIIATDIRLRH